MWLVTGWSNKEIKKKYYTDLVADSAREIKDHEVSEVLRRPIEDWLIHQLDTTKVLSQEESKRLEVVSADGSTMACLHLGNQCKSTVLSSQKQAQV